MEDTQLHFNVIDQRFFRMLGTKNIDLLSTVGNVLV